jgi:D-3-phosphoglycerate dehydrogenase
VRPPVEAQDKAGDTIADMVQLALAGDFVPFAVNVSAGEVSETVRPLPGAGREAGRLYAGLAGSAPSVLEITYEGQIAEYDTRILTLSVLKGFFGPSSDHAGVLRERAAAGRSRRHRGAADDVHHDPTTT